MRAFKTLLIIIGALLALVIILGLIGPSEFRVERSTVIKAPADLVFPYVSHLKNMEAWGPWKEEDPGMQVSFNDKPDGTVGAKSMWKGGSSSGSQEIIEIQPNKAVRTNLSFTEPMTSEHTGTFDLEAMGDSTRVTWGMEGRNGFMGKVMGVFMNMDKMVGPMFEKGLSNLKRVAEADAAMKLDEAGTYAIEAGERPAAVYVGVRKTVAWADLPKFFQESFGATGKALGEAGVQAASAPTAVYFKWDEATGTADLLAGTAIPADAKGRVKGLIELEVPASKAFWIAYVGGYHGMKPAHEALAARLEADNMELNGHVIEEYITDPGGEPDSLKWQTNIIWLARDKTAL